MKIEYGDFRLELGWWAGFAIIILTGIITDAIVAIALGEPSVIIGNSGGIHIEMANKTAENMSVK